MFTLFCSLSILTLVVSFGFIISVFLHSDLFHPQTFPIPLQTGQVELAEHQAQVSPSVLD